MTTPNVLRPRKGDFGLTKGKGLAMFAIRLGTFSRYGHACVALEDPYTDQFDRKVKIKILEAMPNGARIRLALVSEFDWSNVTLTQEQRDSIATEAAAQEGLGYDWPAIVGFVSRVLLKKTVNFSHDHPDDKMICSELVVWVYRTVGIDLALKPGTAAGDVSPGDLGQYLVLH